MSPLLSEDDNAKTIVLKNNHDELPKLAEWINAAAEELEIPFQVSFRMDLVLAEAITNVIDYAYEGPGEQEIHVSMKKDGDNILLEVIDSGKEFNPTAMPDPDLPENLEEAQIGGLGIHLIRNMMDEFDYRREEDQNILTMTAIDSGDDEA